MREDVGMVKAFNKKHRIGARVSYQNHGGEWRETRTRSAAFMLGNHTPAVMVDGSASAVPLSALHESLFSQAIVDKHGAPDHE